MLIGITGTDGAGKGTVVEYLVAHHDFVHYSARAIWIELLEQQGVEATRANMRLVANEMREKHGNDFLITHYLKKISTEHPERVIIESIRALAEAETLKKNGGILIAVDADEKIRYERVQTRRSETDQVSFEEFMRHEELEANDPNPHGMQKRRVMALADHTFVNDTDPQTLYRQVDAYMATLLV